MGSPTPAPPPEESRSRSRAAPPPKESRAAAPPPEESRSRSRSRAAPPPEESRSRAAPPPKESRAAAPPPEDNRSRVASPPTPARAAAPPPEDVRVAPRPEETRVAASPTPEETRAAPPPPATPPEDAGAAAPSGDAPPGPPPDGPLQALLRALTSLAAARPASPTEAPGDAGEDAVLLSARLRAAIAAFLLSGAPIRVADARAQWRPLLERLCALHGAHGLPETALLAENLPGLLAHRLAVALPDAPDRAFEAMDHLRDAVLDAASPEATRLLEAAGLRTAAALGPARTRQCVAEWTDRWRSVTESCLRLDPRASSPAPGGAPPPASPIPLGQPSAGLTTPAYSPIFPAPFVQEGLRFLARASNWATLFSKHLQSVDDATLTPLTRALFTLSLVDEYLTTRDRGIVAPPRLLEQFERTVREIDPAIMIPPIEANKMVRSREEVRVSAALNHLTPRSARAPPGTLMSRVRTDAAVFDPEEPLLSSSALAIFQPAVAALLGSGEPPSAGAQRRLLALLHQTWALIQNTGSPSVVIDALIDAGFTPLHCSHYLLALEGFLAAGGGPGLSELQQLFGCVALTGANVFALAREYGYHSGYVRAFRRVQDACEQAHARLCEAAGLAGGVLRQTLARVMGPVTPTEHLASLRRALVGEFESAERRFGAGRPSPLRETVLIWIDVYGQTEWDITPAAPATPGSALLPAGQPGHAPSVLLAAATRIRFPALDGVPPAVLSDPGFVPYALALVVGDALRATCRAAYLPRSVAFALRVLAWARDFGLGYLPTVEGHRTKIGALITLLEPGADAAAPPPTMQMAENIEQLLRELHAVVRGAIEQLRPVAQLPPVPPPEVATSLLLISMYALAARGVLADLVARADPFVAQIEDAIVLLRIHMRTLSAFFECRFESDGERVYAVVGEAPDRLGPWAPDAMADAVSRYCGTYHDAKRALTAALAGLRAAIAEAMAHLGVCDALATQVSPDGNVMAAVLREVHAFVTVAGGIHARASKLLAGEHVPGFCFMGHFLARWRRLAAAYHAARAATGPRRVAEFVRELHDTWMGLQSDRALVAAPAGSTPDQRAAAVREVLADVDEDAPPPGSAEGRSVLTSRRDLGAWGDYSLGPLGTTTVPPDSVDLSPQGLAVMLGMDWLLMNEMLQVTDGVFRASALRPFPGPDPPRDLEVREEGSLLPLPGSPPRPAADSSREESARPRNDPEEDEEEMLL
ncbi:tegument protein UL37 [Cercopithecine alphaherpesvirus 2]|uniref:Minor tegument protein n=1 Tax=Cercopithecine alphaherpesvirus 2 TaxID=10317 RepID=Q5Y0R5_9ALPH|nr:tegument protein UL37 [Cercopithecine alphaherpesvirus 2]AAU88103.1 minor tegument protein [Cercopithecine alphaherpesvirus 2]